MELLYKSIPLFWTLAEGLIMIVLRQGFLFLRGEKRSQLIFFLFALCMFLVLVYLRFRGEDCMGLLLDMERDINIVMYKKALWNFFCTIWVILEGVIMIYVFRIYKILRTNTKENESEKEETTLLKSNIAWGIPVLVFSFVSLYAFYQYVFISLSMEYVFSFDTIRMISTFYIRICGLFWIIFEWVVAIIGIRTYQLLKDMGEEVQ